MESEKQRNLPQIEAGFVYRLLLVEPQPQRQRFMEREKQRTLLIHPEVMLGTISHA